MSDARAGASTSVSSIAGAATGASAGRSHDAGPSTASRTLRPISADARLVRDKSRARRLVVLAPAGVIGRLHKEKRYANRRQWFAVCTGDATEAFEPCYWESSIEFGQRDAATELVAHLRRTHARIAPPCM